MVDVFDEVEEELRKERYSQLFRAWGPWIGGAALSVIVGVAGYQWYQSHQAGVRESAGAEFMTAQRALEDGNLVSASEQFAAIAADSPRGYATLALMQQAAIALDLGEREEAARLFNEAAARAPDRFTRDVARYKALLIEFEDLSYDDVVLRAEPLTQDDAPLGILARELMGAAAISAERWDEARRHYEQISFALDAPTEMSRRATEALALIEQRAPVEIDSADTLLPTEDSADSVPAAAGSDTQEEG